MYGHRLEPVVLFGSRARGDAHAESDYDVVAFLRDLSDRFAEERPHCRHRSLKPEAAAFQAALQRVLLPRPVQPR